MPGGALVDAARSERFVAGVSIVAICVSALSYAVLPIFPVVLAGSVLHALASCVLGPAMAAISLGLVGHAAIGERFGRNARFASVGNGLAAAAMGACGYLISARAVFIVTVLLLVPALIALRSIAGKRNRSRTGARRAAAPQSRTGRATKPGALMHNRPLSDLRRLPAAVSSRQFGDAAAGRQCGHHALGALGDRHHRGMHRRTATHRRRAVAMGRPARADLGPPAAIADRIRRAADPRALVCRGERARRCSLRSRFSTASPPPYSP